MEAVQHRVCMDSMDEERCEAQLEVALGSEMGGQIWQIRHGDVTDMSRIFRDDLI